VLGIPKEVFEQLVKTRDALDKENHQLRLRLNDAAPEEAAGDRSSSLMPQMPVDGAGH
jgi:hypothetical protein